MRVAVVATEKFQVCLLGLLLAFVGVSFSACSDDDDDVDVTASQLYGTWAWVSDSGWEIDPDGAKETWTNEYAGDNLKFTLNADGTMVMSESGYTGTTTWRLIDEKTIEWDGDAYTIKSFDGKTITVESYEKDEEGEYYEQITFKKE